METEVNPNKISKYFNLPSLGQRERIGKYLNEDKLHKPTLPIHNKKYIFGIEVEVENVPHPEIQAQHTSYWNITSDGSLRNNGVEFVSVPLSLYQVENALRQLSSSLPKDADFSPRTSVHVHMNVRDLDVGQINNLIILYTLVEDLLFDYAGAERKKGVFCIPILDTDYVKNYTTFIQHPDTVVQYWNKYTALNIAPMAEKGTVEFRHMRGTSDVEYILNWVNLLACLKTYAKEHTMKEIMSDVYMLNSNSMYASFVTRIFGEWSRLFKIDEAMLHKKLQSNVSYVKLANVAAGPRKQPTRDIAAEAAQAAITLQDRITRMAATPAPTRTTRIPMYAMPQNWTRDAATLRANTNQLDVILDDTPPQGF